MTICRKHLTRKEAEAVLSRGRWGVLATVSADGQPYGVPLNYVYDDKRQLIYCHCAPSGRKLAHLRTNDRVSFTVVTEEHIVEDAFVSNYESVIVQGRAAIYDEPDQLTEALQLLCAALAPSTTAKQREDVIARYLNGVRIIAIAIEDLSGKENQDT